MYITKNVLNNMQEYQHKIKCQKYLRKFQRREKSHLAVVVGNICNVASEF